MTIAKEEQGGYILQNTKETFLQWRVAARDGAARAYLDSEKVGDGGCAMLRGWEGWGADCNHVICANFSLFYCPAC